MRVELRIASPAKPEAPPEPAKPPTAARSSARITVPPVETKKWQDALSGWSVVAPVLLCAAVLLAWTVFWRLPEKNRLMVVSARESLPVKAPSAAPLSERELEQLRQEFRQVRASLFEKREDIGPFVARLESDARKLGLWMDFTIKPPAPAPAGLTELTSHPVAIQLVDDFGQDGAAHKRFLAWLRGAVSLGRRVEVGSLRLRSNGAGVSEAKVELQLFTAQSHDEAAAK